MTRELAIAHLESCLDELQDAGDARDYGRVYGLAAIAAYERIAVLSTAEAERWQVRFAEGDDDIAQLSEDRRRAAAEHLSRLIERVPQLRRDMELSEMAIADECQSSIEALRVVGAIDDGESKAWQARLLSTQAPWIEAPEQHIPDLDDDSTGFLMAVEVPPGNEEEAAEDAATEAAVAAWPRSESIQRVLVGDPARKEGIAIVAVDVTDDATRVHFHYVQGSASPSEVGALGAAFRATARSLNAPHLEDDLGTVYEPFNPFPGQPSRPHSSTGAGGMPDGGPESLRGHWLYTPAAPPDAREFRISARGKRWLIPG